MSLYPSTGVRASLKQGMICLEVQVLDAQDVFLRNSSVMEWLLLVPEVQPLRYLHIGEWNGGCTFLKDA